jgi:hypothetical protein
MSRNSARFLGSKHSYRYADGRNATCHPDSIVQYTLRRETQREYLHQATGFPTKYDSLKLVVGF